MLDARDRRSTCHTCRRVTEWKPVRGGARLACEGCGDVFPCRHECKHLDCAAAREPLAPVVYGDA